MIANFFWHGPNLSLYEQTCLISFVRSGFEVRLHAFAELSVPEGVRLCDASQHGRVEEVHSYTQAGRKGSIAAFSDIFRYRVLGAEPGWWFDTDLICLADVERFSLAVQGSEKMLVGREHETALGSGVLFISDPEIAAGLEKSASEHGTTFKWGAIGPALVSRFVEENPGVAKVLPADAFYAIPYLDADRLFLEEARTWCEAQTRNSLCVHLWNERLGRWKVPKDVLPCKGSYLASLFDRLEMTTPPNATLPAATMEALRSYGMIGERTRKLLTLAGIIRRLGDRRGASS